MSMWRNRRRALIVLILLTAFLVLIVLPVWLLTREAPTCFDGKQNQGEAGIDCGGSCALMCRHQVQPLKIIWAKMFPIRKGSYDVVAYVENQNVAAGAPRIPYTAKLFDASGTVIAERSGETFALPNERFAIFAGNILSGEKVPAEGSIEIAADFPWVVATAPKKQIVVSDKVLVGTDKVPKLSALLANGELETLRNIEVTVVIYDVTGNSVAVSTTKVAKIQDKGTEKIVFTWPAPLAYVAETEKCETPVDIVLALDRSGSMSSDSTNPPQPLTAAKNAASKFVERLTSVDQAAYVSFATDASYPIDQALTRDITRLKRAIERTAIGKDGLQYTNIGSAIMRAVNELATYRANEKARPIIVLLTDGIPTRPENPQNSADKEYPSVYARDMAEKAKAQEIGIYTIGLGDDVKGDFLAEIATSPEYYYKAASGAELGAIYQEIATAICKKGPSVIEIIPRVNTLSLPTAPLTGQ